MQKYRWLLFDADRTLFDFDKADAVALRQAFQSFGLAFDPAFLAAYRRIDQSLWQAVENREITPGFLKVRRFELLFETIGVAYPGGAFASCYQERLADCSELITDAAEVLQRLRKNYRMAILTNGLQAVQRRRLARSAICPHIAEIVISEEIGFSKPAGEFFDAALARLGNPSRRELLMIGDSWTADIMGAIGSGLDACWYNPDRKPRPGGCELAGEIASLRELADWLE
jgi:2-haloacid dehalogenase